MAEHRKPRILVVDDDASMRYLMEFAFDAEGYEVRAEGDGRDIEGVVVQFRPDLAVLDVRLPVGPDGYAIARRLRAASDIPILFLTVADTHEERGAGFEAGADDYLAKPVDLDELSWRIRALLRRSRRLESPTLQIGDLVLDQEAHIAMRAGEQLELTGTEYQLLCVLARDSGRVVSKQQLLEQVWGFGYDPNVVEVHMSSLRRKLEVHGERLIHTVRGAGYLIRPSDGAGERNGDKLRR
jgi:two-component system OmpR family response regulator